MHVAFQTEDITLHAGKEFDLVEPSLLKRHPLLTAAVSKLQWAQRHRAGLQSNIESFFASPEGRTTLRAKFDSDSGYHSFSVQSLPLICEFEDFFTNSVADIAGALRAALDKLAWMSACDFAASGEPAKPTAVKFPMIDDPGKWSDVGGAQSQLDPLHRDFIKGFQPYQGINGWADSWHGPYLHQLTLLREMSNDDKHRETQPIMLVQANFGLTRSDIAKGVGIYGYDWMFPSLGKSMQENLEMLRVRFVESAEPEIENAGIATPEVTLPEGRRAIQTLDRLERFVHLILSEFSRQFP